MLISTVSQDTVNITILYFCGHVTGILHSDWLSGLLVNCVLEGFQLGLTGGVSTFYTQDR